MQQKKVKKLLKKINNLHQSIIEDGESISEMEKELFLSYIENLYHAVSDGKKTTLSSSKSMIDEDNYLSPENPSKKPKAEKVAIAVSPSSQHDVLEALTEDKVGSEIIDVKEDIVEIKEDLISKIKPKDDPKSLAFEPTENNKEEVRETTNPSVEKTNKTSSKETEELKALFRPIEAKELSAKLANAPIKSIKAKLGINEKLLTVKELFGKNQGAFNETIEQLDNFSSFEEAKTYLVSNTIDKFDWLSDKKIKKATRFIQLVQRRYL